MHAFHFKWAAYLVKCIYDHKFYKHTLYAFMDGLSSERTHDGQMEEEPWEWQRYEPSKLKCTQTTNFEWL